MNIIDSCLGKNDSARLIRGHYDYRIARTAALKAEKSAAKKRARLDAGWAKHIEKSYGVTSDQYHAMLLAQGGVCAICGRRPMKSRLAVDHCHRTGKVRSLLCRKCNSMIGLAGDRPDVLACGVAYLRAHSEGV